MEQRVQIAVHFTWDPAKDEVKIPAEIINTVAVGDDIKTIKIPSSALSDEKRFELLKMMDEQAKKVKRSKPKETKTPEATESGQQSLL